MSRLIAALGLALLTGCQYMPTKDAPGAGPDQPPIEATKIDYVGSAEISELLSFYRYTSDMSPAELQQRLRVLRHQLKPGRCTEERIKSAILITRLPHGKTGSEGLLTPCTEDPLIRHSAPGSLALLMQEIIDLHAAQATSQSKLRETGKALETARNENQQLRKQLEGLKAIERSIQKRDRRLPAEE